jgi:glutamate---cysteine ligase / carboxylate-amine ligase
VAPAAPDQSPIPADLPPNAGALRAAFDGAQRHTVGIEDEVMLLDPDSLELAPLARAVLARLGEDQRFKLELPSSQLEIVTPPSSDLSEVAGSLMEGRRDLARAIEDIARPASAGVHPFSAGVGELNDLDRYHPTIEEFGTIASRQLVAALQVHVGVGDADRALAIYNHVRSYLPLLAALAANAPFYEGRDTGLASVRPKLGELLPRQGVPPAIESWERLADAFAWGAASRSFPSPRTWWWELRLHPAYGTLEFRVPDGQSSVADAIAVAGMIQALVAWLGERHDGGERLDVVDSWRIAENRWSACRRGVEGAMADLQTGTRRSTRESILELIEELTPAARSLGSQRTLEHARRLVAVNGAIAQRGAAQSGGPRAATAWLAERFLEPYPG